MISINLLPIELRRGNRIAAKVVVAAFATALAVSASVGWFGLVWFGNLAEAEKTLASVETKLAGRQQRAGYYDLLQANRKDYAERVQTIQDIGMSRRLWSKFLDELIDVVNNNGNTDRHVAWFDNITVRSDKDGAHVSMPGQVQGDDKDRLANFHEDIESAPFASSMLSKSDPTYKLVTSEGRQPPLSLKFPLKLELASQGAKKK